MTLLSSAIFAYGIFFAVLMQSSSSGIASFTGAIIFLVIIQFGEYTILSKYVTSLASVFSWIIKWISPLFYWLTGLVSAEYNMGLFFICIFCLSVLSFILLLISHYIMKYRGIRR